MPFDDRFRLAATAVVLEIRDGAWGRWGAPARFTPDQAIAYPKRQAELIAAAVEGGITEDEVNRVQQQLADEFGLELRENSYRALDPGGSVATRDEIGPAWPGELPEGTYWWIPATNRLLPGYRPTRLSSSTTQAGVSADLRRVLHRYPGRKDWLLDYESGVAKTVVGINLGIAGAILSVIPFTAAAGVAVTAGNVASQQIWAQEQAKAQAALEEFLLEHQGPEAAQAAAQASQAIDIGPALTAIGGVAAIAATKVAEAMPGQARETVEAVSGAVGSLVAASQVIVDPDASTAEVAAELQEVASGAGFNLSDQAASSIAASLEGPRSALPRRDAEVRRWLTPLDPGAKAALAVRARALAAAREQAAPDAAPLLLGGLLLGLGAWWAGRRR